MKTLVVPVTVRERRGFFQNLRLARASESHSARIVMTLPVAPGRDSLSALTSKELRAWAGPELEALAVAVEDAICSDAAQVTVYVPVAKPEDAAPLGMRAKIFAELVRFRVSELCLAKAKV